MCVCVCVCVCVCPLSVYLIKIAISLSLSLSLIVIIATAVTTYFHERLPSEVLQYIFSFLRERDLVSISQVCRRFHQIASTDKLW